MATNNVLNLNVATQAIQETGTSTTDYVAPGVQQFHASAVKAWVKVGVTANIAASYNVASVTDQGAGQAIVVIATDFSGTEYFAGCAGQCNNGSPLIAVISNNITPTAGQFMIDVYNLSSALTDPIYYHGIACGDQ